MRFQAAILRTAGTPLTVETVETGALQPGDVLVRIRAAGICHTDLEVAEGRLAYPLPIILGHEAAGVVERVGDAVTGLGAGDHVILHWNPHCGHCFYCERAQPILCEKYTRYGAQAVGFGGQPLYRTAAGEGLHSLMYLGAFSEYCIVPAQCAIRVRPEIPFGAACLIGCAVMTGVGAVLRIARVQPGDTVMVIGCGAVGLAAVQGARLAGAAAIVAVDLAEARLELARGVGATHVAHASRDDPMALVRSLTAGRGADAVFEAAGAASAFRLSLEAVRPAGQVVWLGKVGLVEELAFRWGSLMQEKRIVRSSYGGARPARDFPLLVEHYLKGDLKLDPLISRRIALAEINAGLAALKRGEVVRAVVMFNS